MAEYCKMCEWSIETDDYGPCISMDVTDDDEECRDFSPVFAGKPERCAVCGGVLEEVAIAGYAVVVWVIESTDKTRRRVGIVAACTACGTLKGVRR